MLTLDPRTWSAISPLESKILHPKILELITCTEALAIRHSTLWKGDSFCMVPSSQQLKSYANNFNFDIVNFYREVWSLIFQEQ